MSEMYSMTLCTNGNRLNVVDPICNLTNVRLDKKIMVGTYY